MKGSAWVDRGVGNLHLKKFNDTKTQLLVRADTTLGNILLNIMLTESTPVKLMDATRVSIMCVPNPPIDERCPGGEPIAMLVKVKTAEQAKELLKQINQLKS
jgi:nuclear pore complex protein Nup50